MRFRHVLPLMFDFLATCCFDFRFSPRRLSFLRRHAADVFRHTLRCRCHFHADDAATAIYADAAAIYAMPDTLLLMLPLFAMPLPRCRHAAPPHVIMIADTPMIIARHYAYAVFVRHAIIRHYARRHADVSFLPL